MKYEVIAPFIDVEDDDYLYQIGDTYPRNGRKATKKRVEILQGDNVHDMSFIAVKGDEHASTSETGNTN